jgi:hypothetical protein
VPSTSFVPVRIFLISTCHDAHSGKFSVIQGTSDVAKKDSEADIRQATDFMLQTIFDPPDKEEMKQAVGIPKELLDSHGRILLNAEIDRAVADADTRDVLKRINARKYIRTMYEGIDQVVAEDVDGMYIVARRGALGLSSTGRVD